MDDTTGTTASGGETAGRSGRGWGWLFGLFIVGLVVTPIWCFFIGPEIRHNRLVSGGVKVPGRLIDVEETGNMVNDSPELKLTVEFRRKDGTLDTSSTDFIPSLRTVGMYQPGAGVTAAYDPKDPDEITITEIGTSIPGASPAAVPREAADALARQSDSLRRVIDSIGRELERVKRSGK